MKLIYSETSISIPVVNVDQGPCQASMVEFFAEHLIRRLRSLTRKISGKVCSGKLPVGKFILAVF